MARRVEAPIEEVLVAAYTIPTDAPEADGTLAWDRTTLVLVEVRAGGKTGLGYTYADVAAARLVQSKLSGVVAGRDAMDVTACWAAMRHQIRNLGRPGLVSCAISAVDTALWDLKARLLELPLLSLFGRVKDGVPLYGSGGFTSYSNEQLRAQLGGWARRGFRMVKMKVGSRPDEDLAWRLPAAREAIGPKVELFVDANGALHGKDALRMAEAYADFDVRWFEEPVSSDDLAGLRLMRERAPARMDIAAGEYGYDLPYFRSMVGAGAVDVLQVDVTRCGGFTEFLRAAALCMAHNLPLSGHTAPLLHAHVGCALECLRHLEYFHDHARIERMFFEGNLEPEGGELRPDRSRPGLGVELKRRDAQRYAV